MNVQHRQDLFSLSLISDQESLTSSNRQLLLTLDVQLPQHVSRLLPLAMTQLLPALKTCRI